MRDGGARWQRENLATGKLGNSERRATQVRRWRLMRFNGEVCTKQALEDAGPNYGVNPGMGTPLGMSWPGLVQPPVGVFFGLELRNRESRFPKLAWRGVA